MYIKNFQIYKYCLPFVKTINFNGNHLNFRSGVIIKINDKNGNIGYGEISPLPGFHIETMETVIEQLLLLKKKLLGVSLPSVKQVLNGVFQNTLKEFNIFPSVQCGLDFAILNLLANILKQPLYKLFHFQPNLLKPLNGLITKLDQYTITNIERYLMNGYNTIKIKVGRIDIDSEIKTILDVDKYFRGRVGLRLDANAKWEYEEAKYFFKSVKQIYSLEYIEEPLSDYSLINQLYDDCKIPIGLDENLQKYISRFHDLLYPLKAFVLKPPIIGGLNITMDLITLATETNSTSVISDTFQSGIGLICLATLSTVIKNKTAMGFDTCNMIKDDVLITKFCAENGYVDVEKIYRQLCNLNFNNLTEIK